MTTSSRWVQREWYLYGALQTVKGMPPHLLCSSFAVSRGYRFCRTRFIWSVLNLLSNFKVFLTSFCDYSVFLTAFQVYSILLFYRVLSLLLFYFSSYFLDSLNSFSLYVWCIKSMFMCESSETTISCHCQSLSTFQCLSLSLAPIDLLRLVSQ